MNRPVALTLFTLLLVLAGSWAIAASPSSKAKLADQPAQKAELFAAMDDGQIDVKFIARNDREGRLIIKNNTKAPLELKLPEAFAGVPVAAQLGGGGGGFGGGGRGGGGSGGGQQSVGGGGGGLGGGAGGGGGGGFFSIPPEETAKLNFPVVCLDHGLRNPSSSAPYRIVPAGDHVANPAMIELLKAFGNGELNHEAVQAAAWNLNSNLSWDQLATKLTGTRRTPNRQPYFSRDQIKLGMAYASEATRLGEENAEQHKREKEEHAKAAKEAEMERSDAISTSNEGAVEPK